MSDHSSYENLVSFSSPEGKEERIHCEIAKMLLKSLSWTQYTALGATVSLHNISGLLIAELLV